MDIVTVIVFIAGLVTGKVGLFIASLIIAALDIALLSFSACLEKKSKKSTTIVISIMFIIIGISIVKIVLG